MQVVKTKVWSKHTEITFIQNLLTCYRITLWRNTEYCNMTWKGRFQASKLWLRLAVDLIPLECWAEAFNTLGYFWFVMRNKVGQDFDECDIPINLGPRRSMLIFLLNMQSAFKIYIYPFPLVIGKLFKLVPRRLPLTIGNTQRFYFVILTICQVWDTGIQNQWKNCTIPSQELRSSQKFFFLYLGECLIYELKLNYW